MDNYGYYFYRLVHLVGDSPSHIYFNTSILGIHKLAFETPVPSPIDKQPLLPRPESACPSHHPDDENYFYTSATLDSMVGMTPCQANIVDFGPAVMELLLNYEDGQQASVGQVRLDMLNPLIKVDLKVESYLHFALSSKGCPNVDSVSLETKTQDRQNHFSIPWHRTLEWWFSHRQCRVWCKSRTSRPTIPGKKVVIT